ncbi:hypothetical protein PYR77_01440 [Acinetobacter soli]|nr:hypothetical protein [Acinetobacter soli]WEI00777.1 hypothetical protein PYR77_01440 [Acinetobacter soli]
MQHVTLANHPYTLGRVLVLGLGLILLIDGLALIALNKSHFGVQVTCATGIFLTLSSLYGPTLLKNLHIVHVFYAGSIWAGLHFGYGWPA